MSLETETRPEPKPLIPSQYSFSVCVCVCVCVCLISTFWGIYSCKVTVVERVWVSEYTQGPSFQTQACLWSHQ